MTRRELREALPLLPSEEEELDVHVSFKINDRPQVFEIVGVENVYGRTFLSAEPVKHEP